MQQSTISVSKGCFVFKNGFKRQASGHSAKKSRRSQAASTSLLAADLKAQRWYAAYAHTWSHIRTAHDRLQTVGYAHTLAYLRAFVDANRHRSQRSPHDDDDPNMPTVAILTGINQPDHVQLFRTFAQLARAEMRSHVCVLQSMDCPNMKSAIEAMVSGLMEQNNDPDASIDEDEPNAGELRRMRRSQYTMAVLKSWYAQQYAHSDAERPILTVIVPDFENFQRDVLQQFILLLSHNCRRLPIVLVLGVATDLATLHRTLSFADTSRMSLQVSQSATSAHALGTILDEIVLTPECPVALSPKAFTLLADVFLYYDLSIDSFMQGFKYCILEHYSQGNAFAVCAATGSDAKEAIRQLNADDLERIRRLPSFRRYAESLVDYRHLIAVLTDDEALRRQVTKLCMEVRVWLRTWYAALRVLQACVQDLPRTQRLGKQLRDLFGRAAASTPITENADFQSSWDLLAYLSRDELLTVLERCDRTLSAYAERYCSGKDGRQTLLRVTAIREGLSGHLERIRNAGMRPTVAESPGKSADGAFDGKKVLSRQEMQARVLEMSKQPKAISQFTAAVTDALRFLREDVLAVDLVPFARAPPLIELFVFDDVAAVRAHIMGAPRAAMHTALNNPQCYLQCTCCSLDNATQMLSTLPDLSIVYKLHLESGQMINLFDWMQAFRCVVEPEDTDNDDPISPLLQARFTRAVAELQFLGFIKSSKRKTDHVARLTW